MTALAFAGEEKWLTSLPDAEAQGKKDHKLVLMNFTGLDWCSSCMQLESHVLSTPEFANYAEKHLVLVRLDFPRTWMKSQKDQKEANNALQAKYKIYGFPTLVLVNAGGEKVWEYLGSGRESPVELVEKIESARTKSQANQVQSFFALPTDRHPGAFTPR